MILEHNSAQSSTIYHHLRNIFAKVGIASRAEMGQFDLDDHALSDSGGDHDTRTPALGVASRVGTSRA